MGYFDQTLSQMHAPDASGFGSAVSGAIEALLERRRLQKNHADELAQRQAETAANQAHWAADDSRARDISAATLEAHRQAAITKRQEDDERAARAAIPDIVKDVDAQNVPSAMLRAKAAGIRAEQTAPPEWQDAPLPPGGSRDLPYTQDLELTMPGANAPLRYSPRAITDAQKAAAHSRAEVLSPVRALLEARSKRFGQRAAGLFDADVIQGGKDPLGTGIADIRGGEVQDAMDRRAAQARGAAANKPQSLAQKADDDRQLATSAANLLNQELTREEYKPLLVEARDTKLMIDMLDSENPAAQRRALGVWAKQASGPGAVQQSERDQFVNVVGGKDMKMRAMAEEWLNGGSVPAEQRKIFSAAAKDIIQARQVQTLGEIQSSVKDMFASHPNSAFHGYADWAANRVGSSFLPKTGSTPAKSESDADRLKRMGF